MMQIFLNLLNALIKTRDLSFKCKKMLESILGKLNKIILKNGFFLHCQIEKENCVFDCCQQRKK